MKEEIQNWILAGCDYITGIEIYRKYGSNFIKKNSVFLPNKKFPAIEMQLKTELCKIADIPFNPLFPSTEELKKKSLKSQAKETQAKTSHKKQSRKNKHQN